MLIRRANITDLADLVEFTSQEALKVESSIMIPDTL